MWVSVFLVIVFFFFFSFWAWFIEDWRIDFTMVFRIVEFLRHFNIVPLKIGNMPKIALYLKHFLNFSSFFELWSKNEKVEMLESASNYLKFSYVIVKKTSLMHLCLKSKLILTIFERVTDVWNIRIREFMQFLFHETFDSQRYKIINLILNVNYSFQTSEWPTQNINLLHPKLVTPFFRVFTMVFFFVFICEHFFE